MMRSEILMVLAGEVGSLENIQYRVLNSNPFVVAVDGGYDYLRSVGLQPDLSIGDFDSTEYTPEEISNTSAQTIVLEKEKDVTDFEAALKYISTMNDPLLDIYGGIEGDRPDLFLSNLQVAGAYCQKGMHIRFVAKDDKSRIFLLSPGQELYLGNESDKEEVFLSVLSLDSESKVLIENMKYDYHGIMTSKQSLGISNETLKDKVGHIKCESGCLAVFCSSRFLDSKSEEKAAQ